MKPQPQDRSGIGWQPITSPEQVPSLPVGEQLRRVRQLLRGGGFIADPSTREHHEANVPGALAELAHEWRSCPRLGEREVGFGEYVAARLVSKLRAIDAEQRPELYDAHRGYHAASAPLALPDEGSSVGLADPATIIDETLDPSALVAELDRRGMAAASQAVALRAIAEAGRGNVTTPYNFARLLGHDRAAARAGAVATSAYDLVTAAVEAPDLSQRLTVLLRPLRS